MGIFGNRDKLFTTQSGVLVSSVPEDKPQFRRVYSKQLDNRARIDVEIYDLGFMCYNGTLTQPNGNHVFFDPKNIAEKIIDPLLVPLVEAVVEEVMKIDKEFRHSHPSWYKDERGNTWRRD